MSGGRRRTREAEADGGLWLLLAIDGDSERFPYGTQVRNHWQMLPASFRRAAQRREKCCENLACEIGMGARMRPLAAEESDGSVKQNRNGIIEKSIKH